MTGSPASLDVAVTRVQAARVVGRRSRGDRVLVGGRRAAGRGAGMRSRVLKQLRERRPRLLAELPLDAIRRPSARPGRAGGTRLHAGATDRRQGARGRADRVCCCGPPSCRNEFGCIQAINPLPMTLDAFRPTTGYDDVKMVAVARLAAPNIPTMQVDWLRYGPKLAQVALTFGADDIDGVSPRTTRRKGGAARRSRRSAATSRRQGSSRSSATGASRLIALMAPVRIGAVGYLNARPLTWALDRAPERWQVRYDLPVGVRARCCTTVRSISGWCRRSSTCSRPTTASCPVSASARAGRSRRWRCTRAAGRADPAHRARHELAHVGGADSGAVPAPFPHQPASSCRTAPTSRR